MKFWGIRDAATGHFLTKDTRHRSVGVTHAEPSPSGVPFLYLTERGAKQALKWWRDGTTTVRWTGGGDFMTVLGLEYDAPEEEWDTREVPGRKEREMEVVPVSLEPAAITELRTCERCCPVAGHPAAKDCARRHYILGQCPRCDGNRN